MLNKKKKARESSKSSKKFKQSRETNALKQGFEKEAPH